MSNIRKDQYFEVLLCSSNTIFSLSDVALLWHEDDTKMVSTRLQKYVRTGKLVRVRRGLYARDAHYNRFELATRIYTPSYISFETVLTPSGVISQHYQTIFVASYLNRVIVVDGQKIEYIRIKNSILHDKTGIDTNLGYLVATKERAFLDRICVSKGYSVDTIEALDTSRISELLPIYHKKRIRTVPVQNSKKIACFV